MAARLPRDPLGRPLARDSAEAPARLETPHGAVASARAACLRAVELFDAHRFFEAHDFFEYVWKSGEVPQAHRPFWKGVTQLAAGCCHVQRGNARGAAAVLDRAVRHLSGAPTHVDGIETARLIELARRVARGVRQSGAVDQVEFGRFPREPARGGGPAGSR